MSTRPFRFRLEQVREHRARREELTMMELARAIAAVAAQQEKASRAEAAEDAALATVRGLMGDTVELAALRVAHEALVDARRRAAYERSVVESLDVIADERRTELVQASQAREALDGLRRTALARHREDALRAEAGALDELAVRRAARARMRASA